MVTEDYVSFETAKLLKEKGFDEKCFQYWHEEDNELVHSQSTLFRISLTLVSLGQPLQPFRWR